MPFPRLLLTALLLGSAFSLPNPARAQTDADGFVFHFPGGHPGWQEAGTPPSQVTVLRVSADGRAITQTIHNGPLAVAAPQVQEFNR